MDYYEPKPQGFGWSQIAGLVAAGLVLTLWYVVIMPKYFPAPTPPEPKQEAPTDVVIPTAQEETPGDAPINIAEGNPPPVDETEPQAPEDIVVQTAELHAVLTTRGAALKELSLLNYHYRPGESEPLPILGAIAVDDLDDPVLAFGLLFEGATDFVHRNWSLVAREETEAGIRIRMSTHKDGWQVEKEYFFPSQGLVFNVSIGIKNASDQPASAVYSVRTFAGILPDDEPSRYFSVEGVLAGRKDLQSGLNLVKIGAAKAASVKPDRLRISSPMNEWEGLSNRYFACVAAPIANPSSAGNVTALYATPLVPAAATLTGGPGRFNQPNLSLHAKGDTGFLNPGDAVAVSFRVYAGPRSDNLLFQAGRDENGRNRGFNQMITYGMAWLDWLSRILLAVLNFFAWIIPSYGIAILLLTTAVKLAMHPMQKKAFSSMQKMTALAPQVNAIRKRYGNDKSSEAMRRMNLEIMQLYRDNKVSPLGGCLPMLIQFPMFFALYGTLRYAFELRQRGFLWIDDLTWPDALFSLGFTMPYFGWTTFNLLPVLYVLLMFWQQKMQPKASDPQQEQQRKMMIIMPFMFFFIFYNMPSGLVLYFVFSGALGILEQWIVRREVAAVSVAAVSGSGPIEEGSRQTAWDRESEREEKERRKREERRKRQENRRLF